MKARIFAGVLAFGLAFSLALALGLVQPKYGDCKQGAEGRTCTLQGYTLGGK